ncbi:MAG: hypothetical protein O7A62_12585, partial [Alphaproteobacteria bacterium]|nr:hypothetical protein [Alphaproteobacteria bacterium]
MKTTSNQPVTNNLHRDNTLWCKKQAPLNNPADQPTTPLIQRPYYIKNFFIYKSLLGYWPSIPNR